MYRLSVILLLLVNACTPQKDNLLTEEELAEGWELLFDGSSLKGWHLYNDTTNKPSAWTVQNGILRYMADSLKVEHEDLVTNKEYENFDFRFDYRLSPEGNSGVFINVVETKENPTAWATGPEYQLLDTLHPDYKNNVKKRAGCLYNFSPQLTEVTPKGNEHWNHGRIVQKDGHVQFFLNDILTAEEDFKSEEWKKQIAESSFSYFPQFGKATKGKIALQKWYKSVEFKNIKIRVLD
ncbi:protein of unknown function DUF1080 [Leadbetterella byssophila DSM 17132]|uniref:3-keto-alpha-glucoside-1,2-lyase/3-keto-2-hydroxy-glucal hydratase domain-containing protein n=1 Tax=Leadbetterella byssophila (strain DSM 17132 / JCM 16389 / KACC 11308 / NBRC 106382 / 4M15) TaxID=649349 RepID=E4RYS5_LEAB4|nr:DUF1080 domain-containing protein [Leadbetterella byssophila]ADQ17322.1 protein of unknown function DUF1080 [Leadbetterella byssophila DSM 17132]